MPITPTRDHTTPQDLIHGYEIYLQKQTSWAVSHTINSGFKNVNNFRFGHLTANAPQGGPEITAGCGFSSWA